MKEFIHTFSCVTHLFESEKNSLVMAYSDNFFFNSAEKLLVLSQYAGNGLRIEIKYNPKKEKQYFEFRLIGSFYSLLHKILRGLKPQHPESD